MSKHSHAEIFAAVMVEAAQQHAAGTGDANYVTNDLHIVIEEAVARLQPQEFEAMKKELRFRFDEIPEYELEALKSTKRAKDIPKDKGKLCYEVEIDGMPIELRQQGKDRFSVRYWKQLKIGLSYGEAAAELGSCIMHARACESKLDNRMPNER